MSPAKMRPGTRKLSDVARKVVAPSGIVSTGWPAVNATCREKLGIEFDDWQHGTGRLILAKRSDGKLASMIGGVGMSMPRQVGKTYLIGGMTFGLSVNMPGLLTIWSAHHARTHGETFLSMQALAERRQVAPHILQVYTGSGDEEIRFRNGSRILFGARERGFGRGIPGVDMIVDDEAQIMSDRALDAQLATMNTSDFGLAIYVGTPPRPDDDSEAFARMREEAWKGTLEDAAWIEIGADPDADPNDRSMWPQMNPSHPHRTPAESILRLQRKLTTESFRREGMGIWDEAAAHRAAIKKSDWDSLVAAGPDAGVRPHALAVEMRNKQISVSACWIDGEFAHAEEVWAGVNSEAAVDWIASRTRRRTPVMVYGSSAAAALIPQLRARRVAVNQASLGDMAKACGLLENRAKAKTFTHAGQKAVDDALAIAPKVMIGKAGSWGWDLTDESLNIAPIVSMTFALLAATVTKKVPNEGRGGGARGSRSSRGREAVVM